MAIVKCMFCKTEMSELATACPNCGRENKNNNASNARAKTAAIVVAVIIGFFVLIDWSKSEKINTVQVARLIYIYDSLYDQKKSYDQNLNEVILPLKKSLASTSGMDAAFVRAGTKEIIVSFAIHPIMHGGQDENVIFRKAEEAISRIHKSPVSLSTEKDAVKKAVKYYRFLKFEPSGMTDEERGNLSKIKEELEIQKKKAKYQDE